MAATKPPRAQSKRLSLLSALSWSFGNAVLTRMGTFLVGIAVARLLSPEEFGIFAVALVAYAVIMSVNELGVSVVILRAQGDVRHLVPTVSFLCIASSTVFTVALWCAAPYIAGALGSAEAAGPLRVMALAVPLAGLSAVPLMLVQRALRQDQRFLADSINFAVGTAAFFGLVYAGYGVWSLAWSRVLGNAASALVLAVCARRELAWPRLDTKQAPGLIRQGLPLAGSSLLFFAVLNVDYVVVGSILGPVSLGLYVLAYNISSWPVSVFTYVARSVALPVFAARVGDPLAVAVAMRTAIVTIAAVSAPVGLLLAALAEPVVVALYGERWSAASTVLALLAILGMFRSLQELAYDYLVAVQRGVTFLWLQACWLVLLIVLLPLGARSAGNAGVALGHILGLILISPAYVLTLRTAGLSLRPVLAPVARSLCSAIAAAGIASVSAWVLQDGSAWLRLLVGGGTGATLYVLLMHSTFRHLLREVRRSGPVHPPEAFAAQAPA